MSFVMCQRIFGVFLVSASLLCCYIALYSTQQMASLEAPAQVALGVIPVGMERHVKVPIRNASGMEIEFLNLETSCSCTQATIVPNQLGPKKVAILSVTESPGEGTVRSVVNLMYHRIGESEVRRHVVVLTGEGKRERK